MRVSKKLIFGIIGGLLALVLVVGAAVWALPIFKVKNFEVEGVHQLDAAQVQEAAGVPEGGSLGLAKSIESSPFLKSAFWTSMPSASTKVRWNCRAAMPRCRN